MSSWLQLLLGGVVAGCSYLLIGLSWNVVYNACGYLNLAVGQFFVLSAIIATELQQRLPFWHIGLSVVCAVIAAGIVGWLCERYLLRPLQERKLAPLMVTVGLALVLAQLARWMAPALIVRPADWLDGGPFEIAGVFIVRQDLIVVGVAVTSTALLAATLRWSNAGRRVRACTDDRESARTIGIDVAATSTAAFALGAALAGLAGVVIGPVSGVAAGSGEMVAISAFLAVSLGGIGRYGRGAAFALAVGVAEALLARLFGAESRNIIVLAAFVLLLSSSRAADEDYRPRLGLRTPRRHASHAGESASRTRVR